MTIYVFTGPTLTPDAVRAELDAVCLPPVAQGDVYRVALRRPRAIGIIDGYFENVPAVWHKEILWAMAQGIHVFGSASMGALRAAELAPFGVTGVGWVFEQYRDGLLEDDDEVAVTHGPAENGYAAQSEAMVNIRQTLAAAVAAAVISPATGAALIDLAKARFYPERSYPLLLTAGAQAGLPAAELTALRRWLPENRINQKRLDGLAMLRAMRHDLAAEPGAKQVRYRFEHTIWWDHAQRFAGSAEGDDAETVLLDALIDELRLDGDTYGRAHDHAEMRWLALSEARRRGFEAPAALVQETAESWRRAHGLYDPAAMAQWLAENQLTPDEFGRLMREEALVTRERNAIAAEVNRSLADNLRVSGDYGRLLARARDKQRVLAQRGLLNAGLDDAGIERTALLAWHFARLGRPKPADTAWYAFRAGFVDEDAFLIALVREWLYQQTQQRAGATETAPATLAAGVARNGGSE